MERPSHLDLRQPLISIFVLAAFPLLGFREADSAAGKSSGDDKASIQIQIQDARGTLVAGPETRASSSKTTSLAFQREFQPGDRIIFGGPKRMAVQADQNMPECLIYTPLAESNTVSYVIPYGRA